MLKGRIVILSKELQKLRDLKKIIEYYVFSSFRERTERGRLAEISPAEVREVRKRFKAILVANLGYGKLCHDKVVMNVLAFAFQHPLISGLSKRILEDTAEGGYAVASQLGEGLHVFRLLVVLHHEILETVAIPVNRGVKGG